MNLPKRPAMVREAAEKGGQKWYLEILIFLGVFLVGGLMESFPSVFLEFFRARQTGDLLPSGNVPDWYMIASLFATGLMTVTVILFCRLVQKRDGRSLGFRREGAIREYLVGALVGTAMFALAALICVITGTMTLSANRFSVGVWILYLVGFLIQGMSEEVLCRGYFMVSVARKNSLWLAVLLSSLAFSLLHIFNSGVTPLALFNIFLFGVVMSLYVLRRGNLWGVCAVHSLWNFVQGNVFGVSVSGTGSGASPLAATLTEQGKIWNGGAFGAEGGLAVTIVLLLAIAVLLFVVRNGKNTDEKQAAAAVSEPSDGYDPFEA